MKEKHLSSELQFYREAYSDNSTRRSRHFSWEYTPSKSLMILLKRNNLLSDQGKRALDLGCGDGQHINYLNQLGFEVIGIDFSPEAIKLCQDRFRNNPKVKLFHLDLTDSKILNDFGKFDLILDWSVLDHIRAEYLGVYKQNILEGLKNKAYLVLSEFDEFSIKRKNKRHKLSRGHYSRGYSLDELKREFPNLRLVDKIEHSLEDEINNLKFNILLLQKE